MAEIERILTKITGNLYEPFTWESSTKACLNYIAVITAVESNRGGEITFKRKFLKNTIESGSVAFRGSDLPEGTIVEVKNVYKKGSKESITFHGFFTIIYEDDEIHGKRMSKDEIVEYFDAMHEFNKIENPEVEVKLKREINMILSTFVRKLKAKYDKDLVDTVLTDYIARIMPQTPNIENPAE